MGGTGTAYLTSVIGDRQKRPVSMTTDRGANGDICADYSTVPSNQGPVWTRGPAGCSRTAHLVSATAERQMVVPDLASY